MSWTAKDIPHRREVISVVSTAQPRIDLAVQLRRHGAHVFFPIAIAPGNAN